MFVSFVLSHSRGFTCLGGGPVACSISPVWLFSDDINSIELSNCKRLLILSLSLAERPIVQFLKKEQKLDQELTIIK